MKRYGGMSGWLARGAGILALALVAMAGFGGGAQAAASVTVQVTNGDDTVVAGLTSLRQAVASTTGSGIEFLINDAISTLYIGNQTLGYGTMDLTGRDSGWVKGSGSNNVVIRYGTAGAAGFYNFSLFSIGPSYYSSLSSDIKVANSQYDDWTTQRWTVEYAGYTNTTTFDKVEIRGGRASAGGTNTYGSGGAVFGDGGINLVFGDGGKLIDNQAAGVGGALYTLMHVNVNPNTKQYGDVVLGNNFTISNNKSNSIDRGNIPSAIGTLALTPTDENAFSGSGGGAIYTYAGDVRIGNNATIGGTTAAEGNQALGGMYAHGGAIAVGWHWEGSPRVLQRWGDITIGNNLIMGHNTATGNGGALYARVGDITIGNDAQIFNNTSGRFGGAIASHSNINGYSTAPVRGGAVVKIGDRAHIHHNEAVDWGGAISARNLVIGDDLLLEDNKVTGGNSGSYGGGALDVLANVTIGENAIIRRNATSLTTGFGGALHVSNGTIKFGDGVELYDNTALGGGAIYFASGQLNITSNGLVYNNTAETYGGAVYGVTGNVSVGSGSKMYDNNAKKNSGGAIYVSYGNVTVGSQAEFYDNHAGNYGGAVFAGGGSIITGAGVIAYGNIAEGMTNTTGGSTAGTLPNTAEFGGGGAFYGFSVTIGAAGDIHDNQAVLNRNNSGGAIPTNANMLIHGGAIFAVNTLTINGGSSSSTGTVFQNNKTSGHGGAAYVHSSDAGATINLNVSQGYLRFLNNYQNAAVTTGVGGSRNSLYLNRNVALTISGAGSVLFDDPIDAGTGGVAQRGGISTVGNSLTMKGTGVTQFQGVNYLSRADDTGGTVTLTSGTFHLGGANAQFNMLGTSATKNVFNQAAGSTLSGNGTITTSAVGSYNFSGTIAPSTKTYSVNAAGSVTSSGGDYGTLVLNGGKANFDKSTLAMHLDTDTATGKDFIQVGGAVEFKNSNTVDVKFLGSGTEYKIMEAAGGITGNIQSIQSTGYGLNNDRSIYTLELRNGDKELWLITVPIEPPQVMVWTGAGSDLTWDNGDTHKNWVGQDTPKITYFLQGDAVIFDDSAVAANRSVTVGNEVQTPGMRVESGNYTFTGANINISTTHKKANGNTNYENRSDGKLIIGKDANTAATATFSDITVSAQNGIEVNAKGVMRLRNGASVTGGNTGILNAGIVYLEQSEAFTWNTKITNAGTAAAPGQFIKTGNGTMSIKSSTGSDQLLTNRAGIVNIAAGVTWKGGYTQVPGTANTAQLVTGNNAVIDGDAILAGTVDPTGTLQVTGSVDLAGSTVIINAFGDVADKIVATGAGDIETTENGTIFDLRGLTSGQVYTILQTTGAGVIDPNFATAKFLWNGKELSKRASVDIVNQTTTTFDIKLVAPNKYMVWTGTVDSTWGGSNWLANDGSGYVDFENGDTVIFNSSDSRATVTLSEDVIVSDMVVSGSGNYAISGNYTITGDPTSASAADIPNAKGGLDKSGNGTLTFNNKATSFAGAVNVTGGTLALGGSNVFTAGKAGSTGTTLSVTDSTLNIGDSAKLISSGDAVFKQATLSAGSNASMTTENLSFTGTAATFGENAVLTVNGSKFAVASSTMTLGTKTKITVNNGAFTLDGKSELIFTGLLANAGGNDTGSLTTGTIAAKTANIAGKLTADITNIDDFNRLITNPSGTVMNTVITATDSLTMTTAESDRTGERAGYTWIFKKVDNTVVLSVAGTPKGYGSYGGSSNTTNMGKALDKYVADCTDAGKSPFKDDALGRLMMNVAGASNVWDAQRILAQANGAIAVGGSQIAGSSKSVTADWVRHWAMDSIVFDEMNIPDAAVANSDNLGRHAPEYAFSPWRVHAEGLGAWGSQDGVSSDPDYDDRVYGGGMAIDRILGDRVRLGVSATFLQGKQKWSQNSSEVKGDSIFGTLYGRYEADLWFVTGQAFYGKTDVESTRRVSVYNPNLASIAVDETMRADYSTHTYGLEGLLGTDYELGAWTLSPGARLSFSRLESPNFTEKGGDGLQQRIGNNDRDSLELAGLINLTRSYALSGTQSLTPRLSAGLSYEFLDTTTSFDTSFIAYPDIPTWTSYSPEMGSVTFNVGVGFDYRLNDRIAFFVDYQGAFQSNYRRHTGYVGARASF